MNVRIGEEGTARALCPRARRLDGLPSAAPHSGGGQAVGRAALRLPRHAPVAASNSAGWPGWAGTFAPHPRDETAGRPTPVPLVA